MVAALAILLHHEILLMAGLGSLIISVIKALWTKAGPRFWLEIGLFLLLMAAILSIRDEHNRAQHFYERFTETSKQLATLNEPRIFGTINQRFEAVQFHNNQIQQTLEILEVTVGNAGAVTALTDWNLTMIAGSVKIPALGCVMPAELSLPAPFGLRAKIDRQYMLQEITTKPLGRGEFKTGWLIFLLPSQCEPFFKKGTIIRVTGSDTFNHSFEIRYTMKQGPIPFTPDLAMRYTPGSESLFSFMPTPMATPSSVPHR
jgi:hypothetical protein